MAYYVYGNDGSKYGPVDVDGLKQWVSEGRVVATTTLEDTDTAATFPASQLPGLFGPTAGYATSQQPGPGQPNQYAQNPYGEHAQYPRQGYVSAVPIQNHLVKAIISTVLCGCMPVGVVAIVYAAQVNGKQLSGDYAGAQDSANKASTWANVSIGLGMTWGVLWLIITIASATLGK